MSEKVALYVFALVAGGVVGCGAGFLILMLLLSLLEAMNAPTLPSPIPGILALVFLFGCTVLGASWAYVFADRKLNRPTRGLCARCGYDLRGLTEPRCPECGKVFESDR